MKQDKAYIEMQVMDAPLSEQEFEELVKRMRPQLMRMGHEFFGSEMEAEEVVQETWLRVWNVRHSATVTEALVMRIARNCCVSMWRGQRAQVELENVSFDEMPLSSTPQEELEEKEITATAGGGAVEVTVSGKKEVVRVKLAEEVVDPDDIEMLEDLIMAATNEALRQIEDYSAQSMSKITGGLGGLGGGFPF